MKYIVEVDSPQYTSRKRVKRSMERAGKRSYDSTGVNGDDGSEEMGSEEEKKKS